MAIRTAHLRQHYSVNLALQIKDSFTTIDLCARVANRQDTRSLNFFTYKATTQTTLPHSLNNQNQQKKQATFNTVEYNPKIQRLLRPARMKSAVSNVVIDVVRCSHRASRRTKTITKTIQFKSYKPIKYK